jgi:hypothetical protein
MGIFVSPLVILSGNTRPLVILSATQWSKACAFGTTKDPIGLLMTHQSPLPLPRVILSGNESEES